MKIITVFALIALGCLNSVNAQDIIQKNKIFRTWISLNNEPFMIKGILYDIKDSSILVSRSLVNQDYSINNREIVNLHFINIETIQTRRKNSIGKGILIGAITGFAVGGLIGLISGDDPPCSKGTWFCFRLTAGEKALLAGIPLTIPGAGVGALIGSIKVKIPINGDINNFNRNKKKLREYSIMNK